MMQEDHINVISSCTTAYSQYEMHFPHLRHRSNKYVRIMLPSLLGLSIDNFHPLIDHRNTIIIISHNHPDNAFAIPQRRD